MLPLEGSTKEQNPSVMGVRSATKEKPQQIKKLLVRSPDFEDCITFPLISPPSSLPPDLHPFSFTPSPPPQQLPKTKLFENLPKVHLASEEDLRSLSPLSQNLSLQNLSFSFLPMDNLSNMPDSSNTSTPPAQWLSMPSLAAGTATPLRATSSTISVNGTTLSPSLTRVLSMPSLQDPTSHIITELHESCVSLSHSSDAKRKGWASLLDGEDETSLIMQSSCNTSQTNSPSSMRVSTFPSSDTLPSFWRPISSSPRLSGSSIRYHGNKSISSPPSFSSLQNGTAIPHKYSMFSRHHERGLPYCCPNPTMTTPPRGPPRQHTDSQESHENTSACPQTPLFNTQVVSDPWYLQTEFLLSPDIIPSGYCTWVPTPDQQSYSRGKEGVDFF